jgi:hypothetical protein
MACHRPAVLRMSLTITTLTLLSNKRLALRKELARWVLSGRGALAQIFRACIEMHLLLSAVTLRSRGTQESASVLRKNSLYIYIHTHTHTQTHTLMCVLIVMFVVQRVKCVYKYLCLAVTTASECFEVKHLKESRFRKL